MGLRQTISEWVATIKEALDFGSEFPDALEARRVMFAQESARLQHLLEETQKASREKDQLIAKLQTGGTVTGSMVIDGPAYYIRKANTLEGPYCTACFQRNHEIIRITPAPKPKGADGASADWVQCTKCRTPFRSDRISQCLNPARVPAANPSPAGVLLQPDKTRSGSPVSQETRLDDKRQMTENRGQRTDDRGQRTEDRKQEAELQSPPSAVLRQPLPNQQREPKPAQPQNPAPQGTTTTQNEVSGARSPNPIPRVEAPKPAATPSTAPAQESGTPKPVKTAPKPRKEPRRGTSRSEKARGPQREIPRWGSSPAVETGPVEEAPPLQNIPMTSPAPTPDSQLEAPRPSRTRSRTRKPKEQRSGKTMMTDRSKPTG